jgi:hypothetical protein
MRSFFGLLAIGLVASSSSTPTPMLFVCHDAGESFMALPPMQELLAEGYPVTVLALGEPATTIFAPGGGSGVPAATLFDMGINVTVADGTRAARAQLLTPSDIAAVQRYYFSDDGPRLVVSGTVYAMEAQLALALAPAYIVGLDDSFALWSNESLPARLFVKPRRPGQSQVADEMFVCADRYDRISSGRRDVCLQVRRAHRISWLFLPLCFVCCV